MSVVEPPNVTPFPLPEPSPRRRPRLKKLRLFLIFGGLGVLAVVSTVFGMMMAVASDLPALENLPQYRDAKNSTMVDDQGKNIGTLVSNQNRVLVTYDQISAPMRHAMIAIEDKRFYTNNGVDLRGIARAFVADIAQQQSAQGGSTITQQFVKVALAAEGKRTVFEKLREAALAYHLTRKWTKEKILTEYLNAIYFGNGAYGIESAARTYYGSVYPHCGEHGHTMCAALLKPAQAAMIAGVVANPSAFDPNAHPGAAIGRRNQVLRNMLDQGYVTEADYRQGIRQGPPDVQQPYDDSKAPYFTSWVRQQLVDRFGPRKAFEGGLTVRTTLDLSLQDAAQKAIDTILPDRNGPAAALVAIDNKTGAVRAMVGGRATNGRDFATSSFNLATQGERQPGSAFKVFVLAAALRKGISPSSVWTSKKKVFIVPGSHGREKFTVNNFEGDYTGTSTLANALVNSDNSVFADVGYHAGFHNIATLSRRFGIRTPVSTNPAISLGGLGTGVTVLDMAHAYETFAHGGDRVEGTLGASNGGPVGIDEVSVPDGKNKDGTPKDKVLKENKTRLHRIVSQKLVDAEVPIMEGVVQRGTGTAAQIPGVMVAGKTGTTENYGDAWFVGFTDKWTVAVWVGYPNETKPMKTEFHGGAVSGGTFPAQIWRAFVTSGLNIEKQRAASARERQGLPPLPTTTIPDASTVPVPAPGSGTATAPATTTPATGGATLPATTTPSATATPTTPTPPPTPGTLQPPATGETPPPAQTPSPGTGTAAGGAAAAP